MLHLGRGKAHLRAPSGPHRRRIGCFIPAVAGSCQEEGGAGCEAGMLSQRTGPVASKGTHGQGEGTFESQIWAHRFGLSLQPKSNEV